MQRRANNKLSFKYFGPYLNLQKVGAVAYKLQLPATSKIHHVIHVSQLKQVLPSEVTVQHDDQLELLSLHTMGSPHQVLNTRLCKIGNSAVQFALVKWDKMPPTWATWDKVHSLSNCSTT